jgi:hypothetical protein
MSRILVGFDLLLYAAEGSLDIITHHLFNTIRRWDGELEACVTTEALNVALNQLFEMSDRWSVQRQLVQWRQTFIFPTGYPQRFVPQEINLTEAELITAELYQAWQQGVSIVCFNQEPYRLQAAKDCVDVDIYDVIEFEQRCELTSRLNQLLHSNPQFIEKYFFLFLSKHPTEPEQPDEVVEVAEDDFLIVTDAKNHLETDAFENESENDIGQVPLTSQNNCSNGEQSAHAVNPDLPLHRRGIQVSKIPPASDRINPGADGLHILLFLFSQYLLMQMLRDSLTDRLETKGLSIDLATVPKILNLADQSGLLSLLESLSMPEQWAKWLAAGIEDEFAANAAVNVQGAEILASDLKLPDKSQNIKSNTDTNSIDQDGLNQSNSKNINQVNSENRGFSQDAGLEEDIAALSAVSNVVESNSDISRPTFEQDFNVEPDNGRKPDRQPISENIVSEPFAPIELPVLREPILSDPDPQSSPPQPPQPNQTISDPPPEPLPITPDLPLLNIDLNLIPNLIPNVIVNPDTTPLINPFTNPSSDSISISNPRFEILPDLVAGVPFEADETESFSDPSSDSENLPQSLPRLPREDAPIISNPISAPTEDSTPNLDSDFPTEPPPIPAQESDWTAPANPDGNMVFKIQSGKSVIANFGGVGRGVEPSSAVIRRADTLQFIGPGYTAENMLLNQVNRDLIITFEHHTEVEVILQNFVLEDLDNLSIETWAKTTVGNVLFNRHTSIQDSFDVINSDQIIDQVFRVNTVTFLNALDNYTQGRDNSNDVIDGMQGNDHLFGLSGQDKLRGGDGDDTLVGGTGDDILIGGSGNNTLDGGTGRDQFVLSPEGTAVIQGFQPHEDRIGLTGGIASSQISTRLEGANTLLIYNNQTIATLLNIKIDAGAINFTDSGNL